MSKIIRTRKPSVLPYYAAALVFVVLCAVLPVYRLWALAVWRTWTPCWQTSSRSWTLYTA